MSHIAGVQYRHSLKQLTDSYAAIMTHYERTIAILEAEMIQANEAPTRPRNRRPYKAGAQPWIHDATLTINHRHRSCFIGNTIALRLFRMLLQKRNQFVRYDDLLDHVWDGVRSTATIRSAVKVLRKQLREAKMDEIADAIDGRVAGHYGLFVDRLK